MTTTALKIGLIAVLAGAGLSFGRSEARQSVDLDDFPDARLMRDLQDELEDIYYDPYYGHQGLGAAYANEEVTLEDLHAEIMYALGDEGDMDDEGNFLDEEWDEDGDLWAEWDDEDGLLWEDELDLDDWEAEEGWNGEEILLADLELEMEEAGTSLDAVVWEILIAAADGELAARSGASRLVLAGFGLGAQGAADRNRRTPAGRAIRSAPRTITDVIRSR